MDQADLQFKKNIMNRVKTIHYLRVVIRPLLIELLTIIISLVILSFLISIPDILRNLAELPTIILYPTYLFEAFVKTQLVIQALLVIGTLTTAVFLISLFKNISQFINLARSKSI